MIAHMDMDTENTENTDNTDNNQMAMLVNMVKDLHTKYNTLESQYKHMEEQIQNSDTKQKRSRIDEDKYLNTTKDVNYSEFLDELVINDDHLRLYYDYSYEDAFIKTFERVISFTEAKNIPLYRTDAKKLMYYENGKWEPWTKIQIENFVFKVHHKIMHQVMIWQQEHSNELEYKESLQQWFHELLKKLTNRKAFSVDKVKRRLIGILNFDNNIDD